jgi:hypothetical protein
MTPATFTLDEVAGFVSSLLGAVRAGGAIEDGAYTLEQVAERTGLAESTLVKDCRAGILEHVHKGDTRAMTPTQVNRMLKRYSTGGDLADRVADQVRSDPTDEMAEARAASRKAAQRKSPRRPAA